MKNNGDKNKNKGVCEEENRSFVYNRLGMYMFYFYIFYWDAFRTSEFCYLCEVNLVLIGINEIERMRSSIVPLLFVSVGVLMSCRSTGKLIISEENYLEADRQLWKNYEQAGTAIVMQQRTHPELKDSLNNVLQQALERVQADNADLAVRYATVPSALHRVYMVRGEVGKDRLKKVLARLPDSLKNNVYAGYIRRYIETKQLVKGDKYVSFDCQTASGEKYDWGALANKNVLLLFDGLECMGQMNRDYLRNLSAKTDRCDLEILVYRKCSSLEELKKDQEMYPYCTLVSDFQIEGNPMNIIYNSQATPTCFLIDRDGVIREISMGLDSDGFDRFLRADGCLKE